MKPYNGEVIITTEAALQILDRIDAYRRKHINERAIPYDHDMRVAAAFVAQAAGIESRTEWVDMLKADPETRYAKDMAEQGALFEG